MGKVAGHRLGIIVAVGVMAIAIAIAAFVEAGSRVGESSPTLVAPAAAEDSGWNV